MRWKFRRGPPHTVQSKERFNAILIACVENCMLSRRSAAGFRGNRKRLSYRKFDLSRVKLFRKWPEGKCKLLRVSGRFELSTVRIIGSQLYSLKSRWIVAEYLPTCEARRWIFYKTIFTQFEENIMYDGIPNLGDDTTHSRKVRFWARVPLPRNVSIPGSHDCTRKWRHGVLVSRKFKRSLNFRNTWESHLNQ